MSLLALGINHDTAPVEIRERVVFNPEQMGNALIRASQALGVDEVVILSTCNRTEIYLAAHAPVEEIAAGSGSPVLPAAILGWLEDYHALDSGDVEDYHYFHQDEDAIQHMIRVASGLDSLILGEPQIFGQMKSAFAVSEQHGLVSGPLHQAFQQVFSVAKRVRSETAIGTNPVSVASAAVTLSRRIFNTLEDACAMVIGAGKTVELVATHLQEQGVKRLIIANRTLARAQEVADRIGGEAILLSDMPEKLHLADIVISSTASQLPIVGKGTVEEALKVRKHRPVFMVDIAVPRDIEPQVAELSDVYLFTVDDLREVVDEGLRSREKAADEAQAIIRQGVEEILAAQRSRDVVSTIRAYRSQVEAIRDEELQKALRLIERGESPEKVLQQFAQSLTNKFLHQPTAGIKKAGVEGRSDVIDLAQKLFELEKAPENLSRK
jgi:glutamyl-tRNA reductase